MIYKIELRYKRKKIALSFIWKQLIHAVHAISNKPSTDILIQWAVARFKIDFKIKLVWSTVLTCWSLFCKSVKALDGRVLYIY